MKQHLLRMIVLIFSVLMVSCGTKAIPLTEAEISQCNDAFASTVTTEDGFKVNEISCFFTSFYEKTEDINLAEFLRYCPVKERLDDADSEECAAYLAMDPEAADWVTLPGPLYRYPKEAVSSILQKYANITVDDLANTTDVIYLEQYHAFYNMTSDFAPGSFQCIGGEKIGNTLRLWSETDANGMYIQLTLIAQDGVYYIQSFQQVHE